MLFAVLPTFAADQSRPSIIAEATGQAQPSNKPKDSEKDACKADPQAAPKAPSTNPAPNFAPAANTAAKTTTSDGVQATHLGVGWEGVLIRLDTGPDAGKLRIVAHDRRGPQSLRAASDAAPVDNSARTATDLPADWGLNVWRAASRLERGDLPAAEALFEALFQTMQTRPVPRSAVIGGSADNAALLDTLGAGPTSAIICEGVLRCRLSRGGQAGSLIAFMEWVRAARRGPASVAGVWHDPVSTAAASTPEWIGGRLGAQTDTTTGATPLPAMFDAGTGLVIELPPMFVPEPALVALAESDQWSRYISTSTTSTAEGSMPGRPTLDELAGWYRAAIRFEAGLSAEKPAASGSGGRAAGGSASSGDSGVGLRLMRDIVTSRIGEPNERDAARTALRARYVGTRAEPPAWIEAWCRCAVGRSLILEADPEVRRRGVLELLYVPAAFSTQAPYLAGLSLANAAVTLQELGDSAAAGVLVRELRARFPDHAALNWEALRAIPQP